MEGVVGGDEIGLRASIPARMSRIGADCGYGRHNLHRMRIDLVDRTISILV